MQDVNRGKDDLIASNISIENSNYQGMIVEGKNSINFQNFLIKSQY